MLSSFLVDHIERARKHGFLTHLRYIFNFNVSGIVINLQSNLETLPRLTCPEGYAVREMEIDDPEEVATWISIVSRAYPDADESHETFRHHLVSHAYLAAPKVFFVTKGARPVATFTAGFFRNNPEYGGDSRVAVLPEEQRRGVGMFCINYAFHFLRSRGARRGEAVIAAKRTQSLFLHFRCGFQPEFDRKKVTFSPQKRMWGARWIARRRVERLYAQFVVKASADGGQVSGRDGIRLFARRQRGV